MSKQDTKGRKIKTADRVFDILELVRDGNGITLSSIANEVDIATSTAHGYLTTLEDLGYLVREDGEYYLGLTFLHYGIKARNRFEYLEVIKPTLNKVAEQTGEAVWFFAEENSRAIYLLDAEGSNAPRTEGIPGVEVPLHAAAGGKAILSGLPNSRINELSLPKYTDNTITDREELKQEIDQIKKRGVAHNDNEEIEGLRGIACPITVGGRVIGAISVGGPSERILDEDFYEDLPTYLRGVANEIELNLAGSDLPPFGTGY